MSTPSTYEEWSVLRETVQRGALLKRSPSETIQLRICAAWTFLSGLLYAASFLKRRSGGMWTLKKDSEGYYHPNVHTTLPIFAALYAILDVSAVLLVEKNLNHAVDALPVTVQLLAYQALQVFAWVKIWAILYALLTSRLRRHASISNCSPTSKLCSPLVFNTFIIATITIVLLGQVPLIVLLSSSIQRARNQFFDCDLLIQQAASMSTYELNNPIFNADVATQAILSLSILKDENAKANHLFNTYLLFIIAWMSFNTLLFWVSAGFLLHALRSQKNVLSSALENRKMLKILQEETHNKLRENPTSWDIDTEDESKSKKSHKSFDPRTWKSWMDFARDDSLNEVAFWGCVHKLNQPARCSRANLADALVVGEKSADKHINDSALEMHCSTTTRYWYSTMGQTIVSLGMFSSYLVMAFWLLINTSELSGSEKLIEAFVWSNWIWGGGPGLVLGIVACTVAFSPTPVLPQSSKNKSTTAPTGKTTAPSSLNDQGEILPSYKSWPRRALSLFSRKAPNGTASQSIGQTDEIEDTNLILSSSPWRQPPALSIRRSFSFTDLARQSSDSSVFSFRTTHAEPLSQGSNVEMCRDQSNSLTPDPQVEMEWIGSHKAIQGLREST